jgi:hypothetical protein
MYPIIHLQILGKAIAFISAVEHLIGAERQIEVNIHWSESRI